MSTASLFTLDTPELLDGVDVLGTLLARRCLSPADVSDAIEAASGETGFSADRVEAERIPRRRHRERRAEVSLEEIYAEPASLRDLPGEAPERGNCAPRSGSCFPRPRSRHDGTSRRKPRTNLRTSGYSDRLPLAPSNSTMIECSSSAVCFTNLQYWARDRMADNLPFTGERFVPGVGGNIFLEHMHRYALAKRFAVGKDVLDIASGEGFGSNILSEVARSVVGVDIADDAIVHAREKYGNPRLCFKTGPVTAIPLPKDSVDLVVSFETLEHISEHEDMLAEIKRVLRPDGVLVISTPDKAIHSDAANHSNPHHVRELYRDEFHALLASSFAHVRMHGQKVGFGSLIAPQEGAALFFETAAATMETTPGIAAQIYMIGVASDDPAIISGVSGALTQDIQAPSEDVEMADLERGNWTDGASFSRIIRRLIKAHLLYSLSRVKWFTNRRRVKFFLSAAKRDPLIQLRHVDRLMKHSSGSD